MAGCKYYKEIHCELSGSVPDPGTRDGKCKKYTTWNELKNCANYASGRYQNKRVSDDPLKRRDF